MPSDPLLERTVDGRYRITRFVDEGSMMDVYEVDDLRPKPRPLVIKVLRDSFVDEPRVGHALMVEARHLAELESKHVVTVIDCGALDDGRSFLVTEKIHGRSLEEERPLSFDRVCNVLTQLGDVLSDAHQKGIFFHDFEPSNFVLVEGKASDFVMALGVGDAKAALAAQEHANRRPSDVRLFDVSIHRRGWRAYASPEALAYRAVDARSNVYSLACLADALLGDASIPARAKSAFARAGSPNAGDRFATVHELLSAIG